MGSPLNFAISFQNWILIAIFVGKSDRAQMGACNGLNSMKRKFECDVGNILGNGISFVRKSKNITQEQLGRMVGMSKSGISKIENRQKRISAEEAYVLIEVMGEHLEYEVSPMSKELKSIFLSIGTFWFAQEYGMTNLDAFRFLLLFKAIDLNRHSQGITLSMICGLYAQIMEVTFCKLATSARIK